MPAYYTYLISSLPALAFGAEPPFSFAEFLEACRPLVKERDFDLLQNLSLVPDGPVYAGRRETLRQWRGFDTTLRNELAKVRAARKKVDAARYLRRDGFVDPYVTHTAIGAHRNPSPLEGEKMLDAVRWRMLDEICAGHYFDLDFLIIYAHKLLLLERWKKIASADRQVLLSQALEKS